MAVRSGLVGVGVVLLVVACTPPVNPAGPPLADPKRDEAFGTSGVSCSAVRPQTEPDLMGWDPGSRANLSRLRQRGVVAVRYEAKGCNVELELLSSCIGKANAYEFSPYSANEKKVAHNASELFAELPIGAARLGSKLKGDRALRTDYMLAGQYALPPDATFRRSDLHGPDCPKATHVVSAVYVGAFAMAAGERRTMDGRASLFGVGAGGESDASVEVVGDEGNAEACANSQREGKATVLCNVPLRIGLTAIDASAPPQTVAPAATAPAAPAPTAAPSAAAAAPAPPKPVPGPTEMIRVAAGEFMMGSSRDEEAKPVHRVHVNAFEMDRTEVTVAAYRACVAAGACSPAAGSSNDPQLSRTDNQSVGAIHCNGLRSDRDDNPVNCVDWNQATAYCAWVGKRLPTEEEWEYAARGIEERTFPWGEEKPKAQLCLREYAQGGTCPVASYPTDKSPFGILDMGGSVTEWTSSNWSEDYRSKRTAAERVARGGSWNCGSASLIAATYRWHQPPTYRWIGLGFRCAR